MRSKIGYMDKKIKEEGDLGSNVYEAKYHEYLQKISKIEERAKKDKENANNAGKDFQALGGDSSGLLLKEFSALEQQCKV